MRYVLLLTALLVSSPALAYDVCGAYWMDRNAIFDNAGYCFGSKLGKAMFDNKGCTTKSPKLTKAQQAEVAAIRKAEKKWQCKIDSSKSELPYSETGWHKLYDTIPERDDSESSCMGWKGPQLQLLAGTDRSSKVMATLKPGDQVNDYNLPKGDWSFVAIFRNDRFAGMGWAVVPDWSKNCTDIAG